MQSPHHLNEIFLRHIADVDERRFLNFANVGKVRLTPMRIK